MHTECEKLPNFVNRVKKLLWKAGEGAPQDAGKCHPPAPPLCHFEQPAYQKEAVDKYLQKLADAFELPPESRGYNTAMRATPDISAQAMNYCVNQPNNFQQLEASQCTSLKAAKRPH